MASKLIAVKQEAYERLLQWKTEDKSFSDVILELTEPKGNLDRFIGIWSAKEAEEAHADLKRFRKRLSASIRRKRNVLFGQ